MTRRSRFSSLSYFLYKLSLRFKFLTQFNLLLLTFGIISIFLAIFWFFSEGFSWDEISSGLLTELVGIIVTVTVIEILNNVRDNARERKDLLLQMGSPSNAFALEAVRNLRARGWIQPRNRDRRYWQTDIFKHIDLFEANLESVDLSYVNMNKVFLSFSNLKKSFLSYATFHEASMTSANMSESDTMNTSFFKADLTYSILNQVDGFQTNFEQANLEKATLQRSYFAHSRFTNANLANTKCEGSDFSESNFYNSQLTKADFSGANLTGAFLLGAKGKGVNLINANLNSTILIGSQLPGSNLINVDISKAVCRLDDLDNLIMNFSKYYWNLVQFVSYLQEMGYFSFSDAIEFDLPNQWPKIKEELRTKGVQDAIL